MGSGLKFHFRLCFIGGAVPGRVQVHFRVENIYGSCFLFFTRFMPTNGFIQPFVGIISFLSVFHGASDGT